MRRPLARLVFSLAASGVLLVLASPPAAARFRAPDEVPVARLAKNVGAWVEKHPDDAHGHYVLARIHTLALVHESTTVRVYLDARDPDGKLPTVDVPYGEPTSTEEPPRDVLKEHLVQAMAHTARAIELEPEEAAYRLARGYAAEAGALFPDVRPPSPAEGKPLSDVQRKEVEMLVRVLRDGEERARTAAAKALVKTGPEAWPLLDAAREDASGRLRDALEGVASAWWDDAAMRSYRRAFELAKEGDLARPQLPIRGVSQLIAHEAGDAWRKLARKRGVLEEEQAFAEEVAKTLKTLKQKPHGPITPIVVALGGAPSLAALLPAGREATFDLDGDGVSERWPWPSRGAAFLVWDPAGRGEITSGRQLFGSVTWWLFFRDGYEAMAALDDDGDGWLRGDELRGLALWCDADGDGRSGAGEVRPVAAHGIEALSTRARRGADGVLGARDGARLADGTALPTWDWTPHRLR